MSGFHCWPAQGFLLVYCSNYSIKMHCCELDRQMDGQVDGLQHCFVPSAIGGDINKDRC